VAGAFPMLQQNLGALSSNISSALHGELDPETIAMLQNTAAQFGIGSGTPLSPFSGAAGLRHLGDTVEAQKAKGGAMLLSALPTVAKTLTLSPETQLEVANRNATLNAAPDPQAAAREAERLFNAYLAKVQRTGGGGVSFGGGGGGAPRNLNAPGNFNAGPWAPFSGESVWGSRPVEPYYAGTGINWGPQGRAPQDLWGGPQGPELGLWAQQGPELGMWGTGAGGGPQQGTDYWNDWFNWDTGASQQPVYPTDDF